MSTRKNEPATPSELPTAEAWVISWTERLGATAPEAVPSVLRAMTRSLQALLDARRMGQEKMCSSCEVRPAAICQQCSDEAVGHARTMGKIDRVEERVVGQPKPFKAGDFVRIHNGGGRGRDQGGHVSEDPSNVEHLRTEQATAPDPNDIVYGCSECASAGLVAHDRTRAEATKTCPIYLAERDKPRANQPPSDALVPPLNEETMSKAWDDAMRLIRERGEDPDELIRRAGRNLAEGKVEKLGDLWCVYFPERAPYTFSTEEAATRMLNSLRAERTAKAKSFAEEMGECVVCAEPAKFIEPRCRTHQNGQTEPRMADVSPAHGRERHALLDIANKACDPRSPLGGEVGGVPSEPYALLRNIAHQALAAYDDVPVCDCRIRRGTGGPYQLHTPECREHPPQGKAKS